VNGGSVHAPCNSPSLHCLGRLAACGSFFVCRCVFGCCIRLVLVASCTPMFASRTPAFWLVGKLASLCQQPTAGPSYTNASSPGPGPGSSLCNGPLGARTWSGSLTTNSMAIHIHCADGIELGFGSPAMLSRGPPAQACYSHAWFQPTSNRDSTAYGACAPRWHPFFCDPCTSGRGHALLGTIIHVHVQLAKLALRGPIR